MSKLDELKRIAASQEDVACIGPLLKAARLEAELSLAKLGARVPCSRQYLCMLEHGTLVPRLPTLRKIIAAFEQTEEKQHG